MNGWLIATRYFYLRAVKTPVFFVSFPHCAFLIAFCFSVLYENQCKALQTRCIFTAKKGGI